MNTLLLTNITKPSLEDLSRSNSLFNNWNPFKGDCYSGMIPVIELSDEDKEKLIKVDVAPEVKMREGNLVLEIDIEELKRQINWSECIDECAQRIYLINGEFILVPWTDPDISSAVYRLATGRHSAAPGSDQ